MYPDFNVRLVENALAAHLVLLSALCVAERHEIRSLAVPTGGAGRAQGPLPLFCAIGLDRGPGCCQCRSRCARLDFNAGGPAGATWVPVAASL